MSANGEPKLKRVKLSLSSPTNDETSVRNVFCAVKSKRKYKKKPQADSEVGKISFFVEVENPQQYFDHLQLREVKDFSSQSFSSDTLQGKSSE